MAADLQSIRPVNSFQGAFTDAGQNPAREMIWMSVTPIEIQTNFVQQTNVDKMRQAQLNQNEAAQTHAAAITDEITEENKAVIEANPGDAENGIRDSEGNSSEGRKGRGGSRQPDPESGEEPAERGMKDPKKGKFIDITL